MPSQGKLERKLSLEGIPHVNSHNLTATRVAPCSALHCVCAPERPTIASGFVQANRGLGHVV